MRSNRTVERLFDQDAALMAGERTVELRARDRVLAILDNASVLVAMADQGGTLFYVNPAGRAMLGLAKEQDVSGMALVACVAPSERTIIAESAIPAAIRHGVWSGDSALLALNGHQLDVSLLITTHHDAEGRMEGLSLLAQDMSAWTRTSEALRVMQNALLRLSAQHMTIQENERRRIAADLHDGLGQSLGLLVASLENMARLLGQGKAGEAVECLNRIKPNARDTLDELRRIAMNLRPATLDTLGILATLSWHLREIEDACPEIKIERRFSVDEGDVPDYLRTPIFRILQEAGSNAIRHGGANKIRVQLRKIDDTLELTIEDNGRGFDAVSLAGTNAPSRGIGLQSMRERAELSCGIYEIRSTPGKGTRISVRWPASLSDIGPKYAAALGPASEAVRDTKFSDSENPRDLEMLHNLSICVACIRSIKSHG